MVDAMTELDLGVWRVGRATARTGWPAGSLPAGPPRRWRATRRSSATWRRARVPSRAVRGGRRAGLVLDGRSLLVTEWADPFPGSSGGTRSAHGRPQPPRRAARTPAYAGHDAGQQAPPALVLAMGRSHAGRCLASLCRRAAAWRRPRPAGCSPRLRLLSPTPSAAFDARRRSPRWTHGRGSPRAHPPGFRPGERGRDAGRHGPRRVMVMPFMGRACGRWRSSCTRRPAKEPRAGRVRGAAWLPRARHAGSGELDRLGASPDPPPHPPPRSMIRRPVMRRPQMTHVLRQRLRRPHRRRPGSTGLRCQGMHAKRPEGPALNGQRARHVLTAQCPHR